MWVRGLKQEVYKSQVDVNWVAPYVGAWIETAHTTNSNSGAFVAPYVGAWIETYTYL